MTSERQIEKYRGRDNVYFGPKQAETWQLLGKGTEEGAQIRHIICDCTRPGSLPLRDSMPCPCSLSYGSRRLLYWDGRSRFLAYCVMDVASPTSCQSERLSGVRASCIGHVSDYSCSRRRQADCRLGDDIISLAWTVPRIRIKS